MKIAEIRCHAGLRGVAALLVVAYHFQFGGDQRLPIETATPFFQRGYLMVDLFFLLSGFIISYVNDGDRVAPVPLREYRTFIARRLIRLYPLMLFTLGCFVLYRAALTLLLYATHARAQVDWSSTSLAVLGGQALLVCAWLPLPSGWNIPSWSISAELFAYLLFPLLVTLHARRPQVALVLLATIATGFYASVAATTGSLDIIRVFAPFRCLAGFSLGMLLYYGRNPIGRLPLPALWLLQITAVVGCGALLLQAANDVLIIPVFAILVITTWTDKGPVGWLLGLSSFVYLGEISYSIYLNHVLVNEVIDFGWPRIVHLADPDLDRALRLIACTVAILAVSHFTFRLIEVPARRSLTKKLLGRRERPIELSPPAP